VPVPVPVPVPLPPPPTSVPGITVMKPLHGAEWNLLGNLASFCRQNYPGPIQFLFGVNDPADPALSAVQALRQLHPEAQVTVVADAHLHGPNRKVSNLINMMPKAQHDFLVFADSDVGVDPNYLASLVAELQRPGIGLVTCIYRGEPAPGFWPRLSRIATNYQFLPSVVTGLALGRARPCFGQTIALRRSTLEEIGGLARFNRHLAEDNAIGEAVRATGAQVAVMPFAVAHTCVETDFPRLVAHELRWSRTIRAVDPIGHLGSILMHPFALAAIALALSEGAPWACLLAGGALAARVALAFCVDRALRQPRRDAWLLPFYDLLAMGIYVATYGSRVVFWRGHRYRVDARGMLSAAELP